MDISNDFEVCIIDDDDEVRRSLAFMLATSGIKSRAYPDGKSFLEGLPELNPGPVLLDLRMPGMDGMEVLRELRARVPDWPVIVITAHGEVGAAVRALKLGALDFLVKPFPEELLQTCLRNAAAMLAERLGRSAA